MNLLRNLFSMTAMRIVSAALTLSLVLAFSRFGGLAQLGHFSLLMTLFLLFQLLPLLGLHLYLIREISAVPERVEHHLTNAIVLAGAASVGLALLLALGGTWIYADRPEIHPALTLVALALIPTAPIAAIEAALLAQQRMTLVARVNIQENILRTLPALLLVMQGQGLTAVFGVMLLGRLFALWRYARLAKLPLRQWRQQVSGATLRTYLHNIPTFLGIALLGAVSTRLDVLLLSRLGTAEQLGLYAVAYKFFELGVMVPQMLTVVLYPRLTALHADSRQKMLDLLGVAIRFPLLLAIPPLIVCASFAHELFALFGVADPGAHWVLWALLAALPGTGINQLLASCMLVIGRSDLDLRTLLIGTTLTVLLLALLVPLAGAAGAALSVLLMSLATPALRGFILDPLLPVLRVSRVALLPVLPGLVMLAALLLPVAGWLRLLAGIGLYLAVAWRLGLLSPQAWRDQLARSAS